MWGSSHMLKGLRENWSKNSAFMNNCCKIWIIDKKFQQIGTCHLSTWPWKNWSWKVHFYEITFSLFFLFQQKNKIAKKICWFFLPHFLHEFWISRHPLIFCATVYDLQIRKVRKKGATRNKGAHLCRNIANVAMLRDERGLHMHSVENNEFFYYLNFAWN